jgi:3-deoxy-D-manno-octulosonate 8-phosphate phosphatase (KDO 8-P phosphatase)
MNLLQKFKPIKIFIFDVDGVLTDGSLLIQSGEQQLRSMHVRDGLGLQMAIKNGYRVLIISGGFSGPAKERLINLGVSDIHMSIEDKKQFVSEYIKNISLDWNDALYMGDDLPDIQLLKAVGVSCCPADAIAEIREFADYISPLKGGQGCARDVIEKVLKINNHWRYETDIVSK